jgi:putative CocE/NonD family hydrolase
MYKRLALYAFCFTLVACTNTPDSKSNKFNPPEGVSLEENVQIEMRDGARLNTLLMLPDEAQHRHVPTILIRTPYKSELSVRSDLARKLLEQGYALIMQHERGRYFSEGEYKMLGGALNDGWDTLDWIVEQPWSNGEVGTYGCSSSGENQLKLAAAGHPAHKAMIAGSVGVGIAEAGPFREQGNFWRGGVWQQGWLNYFYSAMMQDWPQLPASMSNADRQHTISFFDLINAGWDVPSSAFNQPRMHLPMIDIMKVMDAPRNELNAYLEAGPVDPSWAELRVSQGELIAIPGLWFESLYDISARSSIAYFEWNRAANVAAGSNNQVMRITQGGHCSFGKARKEQKHSKIGDLELGDMRYDFVGITVDWFNRWLKPQQQSNIDISPAYTVFVGYGQWLTADKLPMQGGQQWYLSASGGLENSITEAEANFPYRYDPANPVPSLGGEIAGTGDDQFDGSFDQREIQKRDDVLVFTSEPFANEVTVFGMAEIGLSVSSDRPDTDFTVKILDVYPDGRAFNIGDTILRMRYREGLEKPVFMQDGVIYDISLPPIMLSRTLRKKHRLQVEISSSNFPAYARNLNTDQDPYTSEDFATATNTLHVGGIHKSFIRLPVTAELTEKP